MAVNTIQPDQTQEQPAPTPPKIKPVTVPPVATTATTLPTPNAPSAAPSLSVPPVAPPPVAPVAPTANVAPVAVPTLSGNWTPPVAAPTSAPLIASAAGGTMTPQGTDANPFKGYTTDQGGKFGGYDSTPLANDPSGRTFKQYDQAFVTNANKLPQVPPLSREEFAAMSAADSGANAVKDKIANGQPVSDKELAFVRQARGMELQQDTASPTFGTFGTKAGTATAADPAEQARLLASGATTGSDTTVPVGASPSASISPVAVAPSGTTESAIFKPGGVQTITAPASSASSVLPSATAPTSGAAGSVTTTPYTADKNLLDQLISVGPTADRFKLAQDKFGQFETDTAPAFEEANRRTLRAGAAVGGLGSGDLRTSVGNLNLDRTRELGNERAKLFTDALTGSIDDAYRNVGIAQQQQGFQAGRADTAFNQGVTQAQLQDTLTNSAFGRALQQLVVGQGGSPSDALLALSAILSGQASDAANALTGLIKGNAAASSGGGNTQGLLDWIKTLINQGSGSTPTAAGSTYSGAGGMIPAGAS